VRFRRPRAAAAVLVASLGLSACELDVYSFPLPGGPDTGDDPITVTAQFEDVLDLVPKSTVKVNDVSVGRVTAIDLEGYTATVTMELRNDLELPDDVRARLRQTSLLGEKFVDLSAPPNGGSGLLEDDDEIPLARTGKNPEVEEVLGALSLVLNGGGVAQLKTIASELNNALEGREDSVRSVLDQVDTLVEVLDDNKADVVNAIERLNQLAISVQRQQGTIDAALDELPSALRSLDRQRDDLVQMLQALNDLGDVGVRVIRQSKDTTIRTLRQLQPVLTELANSGDDFVKAFNVFLTYPFVDEVVGRDPQVARNLHMGDYTNLSIQLDIDLSLGLDGFPTELPTLLPSGLNPTELLGLVADCLASGDLTSEACQQVLATPELLLNLIEECQRPRNEDAVVCSLLGNVPGLPQLPGLPGAGGDGGGNGGGNGGGGNGGGAGGVLPDLPLLGSLFRSSFDPHRGPTVEQLTALYDDDLVSLFVPGLMTR